MCEHWGFTVSLWGGTRRRARRALSEDGVARRGPRNFSARRSRKMLLGAAPPRMAKDMSAAGRSLMGYTIETLLVNFIILICTYDKNDIDKHRSRSEIGRAH